MYKYYLRRVLQFHLFNSLLFSPYHTNSQAAILFIIDVESEAPVFL